MAGFGGAEFAVLELGGGVGACRIDAGADERGLDEAAFAGFLAFDDGGEDATDGCHAGGVVADAGAQDGRFGTFYGLQPADAGAGIEGGDVEAGTVALGAFKSVAGDARVNQTGVDGGE